MTKPKVAANTVPDAAILTHLPDGRAIGLAGKDKDTLVVGYPYEEAIESGVAVEAVIVINEGVESTITRDKTRTCYTWHVVNIDTGSA